jgi:hypothetical protein
MTLYDLFTGHFTWLGLLQEIGPLLIAAVSAFFAGYWHGRVVELQCASPVSTATSMPNAAPKDAYPGWNNQRPPFL